MNIGTIRSIRSSLILALDLVAIVSIFSGIYYLRLNQLPEFWSPELWLIILTFISILFVAGTYSKERGTKLPSLPVRTFLVSAIAGLVCIIWLYILGPQSFSKYFGRGILPGATFLFGAFATLIRFAINRIYHLQEEGAELLYIGFSQSGSAFLKELSNHSEVRSITFATPVDIKSAFERYSSDKSDVEKLLLNPQWQGIIIDPSYNVNESETTQLISLRMRGIPVLSLAEFYEKFWFMIPVRDIGDDWFLRSQGFSMLGNPISSRLKRILDVAMSFAFLTITAPVILFFGVLIKLSSKGPILYSQTRVGFKNRQFTLYKLRTMYQDAEDQGARWAEENDSRITPLGRFLRQTRIDELPQCLNVLRGEMSFVGPRPERPEFTKHLTEQIPYYNLRHLVKPGITGWAQIIFPYGASVEDSLKKLQYELYYIKNQSLLLDLNIMLRTLITVFQRAGR